jgi:general secretion pathway protein L
VATCFLFTRQLDDDGCLSITLDQSGQIEAPLEKRSFESIITLQATVSRTIAVVPSELAGIQEVEFAWLGDRKARAAIPYALEEQLAQPVTSVHFAFDRAFYQNQKYLIVIFDKQGMVDLKRKFADASIKIDALTIDWFAVPSNQAFLTDKNLLVHEPAFKGALDGELIDVYMKKQPLVTQMLTFSDSLTDRKLPEELTKMDLSADVFIAQQLMKLPFINLFQGEFHQDTRKSSTQFWYQLSGALLGLWLVSIVIFDAIQLYSLNRKHAQLDEQIAVIYKEFFPTAQHVISPKFRITELLKSSTNQGEGALWPLLDKIAPALQQKQLTIQQLRFQDQTLSITLNANDFETLENLQLMLKNEGVKVTQTQASSQDNQVIATLELNL